MSTHTAWPDRATLQACATNPESHFTLPELRDATFTPGRMGLPNVWSGGRAMVVKANRRAGGSLAVRFLMQDNPEARTRYETLDRFLRMNRLRSTVETRWVENGLRIDDRTFPIMLMAWVDGDGLDKYIAHVVNAPDANAELQVLADAWRESCRSLHNAGMGHGDVHAGNTLVRSTGPGSVDLRLVDYDNVWVPDLHIPSREAGHPAFQHPRRPAQTRGTAQDAFPNTLTYLSLIALANDPGLWERHHPDSDDLLLFERADLTAPGNGTWPALLASGDSQVRGLAEATHEWLRRSWDAYPSLEHVLAAGSNETPRENRAQERGPNVWPPASKAQGNPAWNAIPAPNRAGQPKFGKAGFAAAPPVGQSGSRQQQAWTSVPRPPLPPPIPPTAAPTGGGNGSAVAIILVAIIVIAMILLIVAVR